MTEKLDWNRARHRDEDEGDYPVVGKTYGLDQQPRQVVAIHSDTRRVEWRRPGWAEGRTLQIEAARWRRWWLSVTQ